MHFGEILWTYEVWHIKFSSAYSRFRPLTIYASCINNHALISHTSLSIKNDIIILSCSLLHYPVAYRLTICDVLHLMGDQNMLKFDWIHYFTLWIYFLSISYQFCCQLKWTIFIRCSFRMPYHFLHSLCSSVWVVL